MLTALYFVSFVLFGVLVVCASIAMYALVLLLNTFKRYEKDGRSYCKCL